MLNRHLKFAAAGAAASLAFGLAATPADAQSRHQPNNVRGVYGYGPVSVNTTGAINRNFHRNAYGRNVYGRSVYGRSVYNRGGYYRSGFYRNGYYRSGYYRRGNAGGALAAGLIGGLAVGAIGSALASPAYGYGYSYPAYGYGYGYSPVVYSDNYPPVFSPLRSLNSSRDLVYQGFDNPWNCRVVRQRVQLDPFTVGVRSVRVCD